MGRPLHLVTVPFPPWPVLCLLPCIGLEVRIYSFLVAFQIPMMSLLVLKARSMWLRARRGLPSPGLQHRLSTLAGSRLSAFPCCPEAWGGAEHLCGCHGNDASIPPHPRLLCTCIYKLTRHLCWVNLHTYSLLPDGRHSGMVNLHLSLLLVEIFLQETLTFLLNKIISKHTHTQRAALVNTYLEPQFTML